MQKAYRLEFWANQGEDLIFRGAVVVWAESMDAAIADSGKLVDEVVLVRCVPTRTVGA